ncbi:hypothetical protein ACP70R_016435 [Stipagrostis hirtigluma subsp. patula]
MATPKCARRPCAVSRRAIANTPVMCTSWSEGTPPVRRSANYQPNVWNYGSVESLAAAKHQHNPVDPLSSDKLKFRVRHLLLEEAELLPKLEVIDTLQRLGIAYHFDEEISGMLNSISMARQEVADSMDGDVYFMTLLFRLLRQNNSPTSPELLLRSLKQDGNSDIKESLRNDMKGLLSLYEASHLAFEGEDLLDEARIFASKALSERLPSMNPHLRSSVRNALAIPLHWTAPRLQTRWFINHYAGDTQADPLMLHFAKLDFNNVQSLHQQELARITRWWRHANLKENLPFARDRLIECFYFATGVVSEPCLGAAREVVAKTFALIVVLDDIYDIYGTLDELVMFTNAIERWEASASEQLPEYMKAIYSTILNTSNEVAENVLRQDGCDVRFLLKKAWHDLCKAFLLEAKWHHSNYKPTLKEYLDNGWVSVSGPLMLIHAFPMLKMDITPKSIKQFESYPKLIQMVSKIFRLCNDSATHSEELKRGDAPSSIAIYMFENMTKEHDAREAMSRGGAKGGAGGAAAPPGSKNARYFASDRALAVHRRTTAGDAGRAPSATAWGRAIYSQDLPFLPHHQI